MIDWTFALLFRPEIVKIDCDTTSLLREAAVGAVSDDTRSEARLRRWARSPSRGSNPLPTTRHPRRETGSAEFMSFNSHTIQILLYL
jgi:hypothetical protein